MKKELQETLFAKYPNIFKQRHEVPQKTCMCWGITCGDGWYILIDVLCQNIQSHVMLINRVIKEKREKQRPTLVPTAYTPDMTCEAAQVKSKFGGLRFYIDGGDDTIKGMIRLAESMSLQICETTGKAKQHA